jgi:hypothetical protein
LSGCNRDSCSRNDTLVGFKRLLNELADSLGARLFVFVSSERQRFPRIYCRLSGVTDRRNLLLGISDGCVEIVVECDRTYQIIQISTHQLQHAIQLGPSGVRRPPKPRLSIKDT